MTLGFFVTVEIEGLELPPEALGATSNLIADAIGRGAAARVRAELNKTWLHDFPAVLQVAAIEGVTVTEGGAR